MIPALMVGLGIHIFPYSPRWLSMRGRNEDSLQSLSKLRRLPSDDSRVQLEWKGIMAEVRLEQEVMRRRHGDCNAVMLEIKGWIDLFTPRYRRRTMVAAAIPFFQQFSGIVSCSPLTYLVRSCGLTLDRTPSSTMLQPSSLPSVNHRRRLSFSLA